MFFLGALLGVTGVAAFGNALGACVGFIPLAVARIFISIGELPVEDETPEETEEEAEEMLEEAKILETGARLIAAGADALVAGSAVFAAPDPEGMIHSLKDL